jgi:hypothetical protein
VRGDPPRFNAGPWSGLSAVNHRLVDRAAGSARSNPILPYNIVSPRTRTEDPESDGAAQSNPPAPSSQVIRS